MNKEVAKKLSAVSLIGGTLLSISGIVESFGAEDRASIAMQQVKQEIPGYSEYIASQKIVDEFTSNGNKTLTKEIENGAREVKIEIPENVTQAQKILFSKKDDFTEGYNLYNEKLAINTPIIFKAMGGVIIMGVSALFLLLMPWIKDKPYQKTKQAKLIVKKS